MEMKNLQRAINAWVTILTTRRVIVDEKILQNEATATFKTNQKIHVILKPRNTNEVSAVLKVANRMSIPVYPISGGKNWGLGSKVPQDNGALIDLSLMKKITAFDETMAYMTVEPGVTFQAATQYLERKNSSLMLDTIGSTPDASIIGNTAERGHGMAFYADRFNFVCGMEVVLPNGDVIKTGFENYENSVLGPLAKWGLGPYVDGLFTQSNLGIITKLTVWLRSKPRFFQSFMFHIDDEKKLADVMNIWRQMGLDGFSSSLRIFNDMRMISFIQRFPENVSTPLSAAAQSTLRKSLKLGKWVGLGGLYAPSAAHAAADKQFIIDKIGAHVAHLSFYDQATVDAHYSTADQATRNELDFMFNKTLLRGNVSASGVNMAYWRKPHTVAISDIHRDHCGVLWYCLSIPFTGSDTVNAIAIAHRTSKKYGFELNIGFLFITQRTLDITGGICYDRDVKGEDDKAMRCHDELMEAMVKKGYSPYRLGIQSMDFIRLKNSGSLKLNQQFKQLLDPNNILAPGRYIQKKKK